MVNLSIFPLLLSLVVLVAHPPGHVAGKYAAMIRAASLKENLTVIADDIMEGRSTGKRGQKMAAAFIRAGFEEAGLVGPIQNDYFQTMELYTGIAGETYIESQAGRLNNFEEIAYTGLDDSGGVVSTTLVFGGNGSADALNQADVKNKAVVIFSGKDLYAMNRSVTLARERGANMVLICSVVNPEAFDRQKEQIESSVNAGGLSLTPPAPNPYERPGYFVLSIDALEKLMGVSASVLETASNTGGAALRKIKPVAIRYKTSRDVKVVKTENVLGYVEGSDKKDEVVVISAHYDHIGFRPGATGDGIFNGADDDGSGTVTVMELAKVFAAAKKDGHGPRRTVLFLTFTGEEAGLLGSAYYTEHPVFSLQQTVVDLNIDMVGRRDAAHATSEPYIYVIGDDKLSTTLHEISESVNAQYTHLVFDYTYNDASHPQRLYYRSDHYNFARNDIPIIFYFDGLHEDYHRPSDEVEKIDFDLLARRAECVFYTAWEIANREERVVPDRKR